MPLVTVRVRLERYDSLYLISKCCLGVPDKANESRVCKVLSPGLALILQVKVEKVGLNAMRVFFFYVQTLLT